MQTASAQSTAEAEYTALASCFPGIGWVRSLLSAVYKAQAPVTAIFQDNLGTISWTEDVQGLRKVKHVGIKYHYVRYHVWNEAFSVL